MGNYSKTFEWIDFPQGRVRYAGSKRGREEPPIETFTVEYRGGVYYGEIDERYLADGNRYNLEVVSFGWVIHDWVGTEPDPCSCAAFSFDELSEVQAMVCGAIKAWLKLEDRPSFLYESFQSRFMGEVAFRDGWALLKDDEEDV
ncbi:hypothetical protein [Luteibacter sp. UNCMF366Tsu5.1]|uniref:hypothetical protein n=1 Tax=Luteibacter sp. UNCMF366Tsu5.1 TaxID=1502758 RepID=UPI000908D97D|nr:hypothetical protein [Luteibacter sp. UNCMF366Tsu5.1]SFW75717.1 hypothetical protein SAMN02800691_3577 [Luteibacter sp. UNCMF366Tsu5.1]